MSDGLALATSPRVAEPSVQPRIHSLTGLSTSAPMWSPQDHKSGLTVSTCWFSPYATFKCLRSSPSFPSTTDHWSHCLFSTGTRRVRALVGALVPLPFPLHSKLPVQKHTYCVAELLDPALLQFEESLDLLLWCTISMKTPYFFWVLLFPPCRQLLTLIISLFLGLFTLGGRILAKN